MDYPIKETILAKAVVKRRFQLATIALRPLLPLIKIGYQAIFRRNRSVRPYNHAMSQIIKGAISGDYPELSIDYSRVLLSKGAYEQVSEPAVLRSGDSLELTYGTVGAKADDIVIWAVLCVEMEEVLATQGTRIEGGLSLHIPRHLAPYRHHHYLIVGDRSYNRFAQSKYLGVY